MAHSGNGPVGANRGRAACALAVGILGWIALLSCRLPADLERHLPILARNLASGVFLTAGVLRMATWRLSDDWAAARAGIALLAMGTALPSAVVLHGIVHDGELVDLEAPATRLLYVVPVLVLVLAGARRSRRVMRRSLGLLAIATVVLPVVLLTAAGRTPSDDHHLVAWLAIESVTTAVWLTLALQCWLRRDRPGQATPGWSVIALLLFAAAEGAAAWSIADPGAIHGLAGGFQLGAAAIALVLAAASVREALRVETGAAGELTRALVESEMRLSALEQQQRERLHDARSAVLGVLSASELLAAPSHLTALDPAALRSLVAGELHRLQGLLDSDRVEPVQPFDLAGAVEAVVLAHRMDGMHLDVDLAGVRVEGRPEATATVLDNLLTNARRHAPTAEVRVTARQAGEVVEVCVDDDGPGIAADERELVLRAGVRGSGALGAGSGLGLHSAACTMVKQGGMLDVQGRPSGGTRVLLRLPAAAVAVPDVAMAS